MSDGPRVKRRVEIFISAIDRHVNGMQTSCRYLWSAARARSWPSSAASSICLRLGRIDCPVSLSTNRYGAVRRLPASMTSGDQHQ
jgi:hypothetical protein